MLTEQMPAMACRCPVGELIPFHCTLWHGTCTVMQMTANWYANGEVRTS